MSVRYIHDILKVDVIVKKALMQTLRVKAQTGEINAEDFLTAKFSISGVLITSQVRQGDKIRNLFAEATEINQPVQFWKDEKIVHTLRPVEAYVLDESGNRLDEAGVEYPIHTAQRWILAQYLPGEAEMSANLGDLLKAPEGEVVLDPSITFGDLYGIGSCDDSYVDQANSGTNYGTNQYLYLTGTYGAEKRILIGFNVGSYLDDRIITSAKIRLYNDNIANVESGVYARAFKQNDSWVENTVTWSNQGMFIGDKYVGFGARLPASSGSWVEFESTQPFRIHFKTLYLLRNLFCKF